MTDLMTLLAERLAAYPDSRRWIIGFSGGLDSTVLLHLCAALPSHPPILALHINHQLQPQADTWVKQCERVARDLDVDFKVCRVNPVSGSEASARNARYQAFSEVLMPGDLLLLAQHANDQSETFLQRLLRGSGVRGLSAIAAARCFKNTPLLRPLLDQSRPRLRQWAEAHRLSWIEDPSNADNRYMRNWLRNEILPRLRERFPQLDRRIEETCEQMSEAAELLWERARDDAKEIEPQPGELQLDRLSHLTPARQRNLLHHWLRHYTGEALGRERLERIEQELIAAAEDAQPRINIGQFQLRRFRGRLYLIEVYPAAKPHLIELSATTMALPAGELSFHQADMGLAAGCYTLDTRRYGDRLRPMGRGGSVKLKQLFQERGIAPWLRDSWPLLRRNGEIAAVAGICLCEGFESNEGLLPQWAAFGLSDASHFGRL